MHDSSRYGLSKNVIFRGKEFLIRSIGRLEEKRNDWQGRHKPAKMRVFLILSIGGRFLHEEVRYG